MMVLKHLLLDAVNHYVYSGDHYLKFHRDIVVMMWRLST